MPPCSTRWLATPEPATTGLPGVHDRDLHLPPALIGLLGAKDAKGKSGLDKLLGTFTSAGSGATASSCVGTGPNKSITPAQVKQGLGEKTLVNLASQSGLPLGDVTKGLSKLLPVVVNELTPKAEVPRPTALESALAGLAGLMQK